MTTIITFTFHDGEILKSEYIHVIALSGRKHIDILSRRQQKKKKKKKRLIKEKMDIEKKKENMYKEMQNKFDEFLKTYGNEILKVLRRLKKTHFIIH